MWFVLGGSFVGLPMFEAGTELRLVSPDLLTVYSSGRVVDDQLVIDLPLDASMEIRLLVFPPDASDAVIAEVLSGAAAIHGQVADDRSDIMVRFANVEDAVSLRAWLMDERGVRLVLVTRRSS
ncbi:hypothetical protein BH23DEI1_BH23DEI1_06750 [soil metagenome]